MLRRILRDPLAHFALLGIALFALANFVGEDESAALPGGGEIIVTRGRIASLTEQFSKVWQRPPTKEELSGLIDDHVREEVYYREAVAMRLDQDDTIVRRRMRQKMEFISEDLATLEEPTDQELQQFLDTQPERFREASVFSFKQVYLNEEERGATAQADADALLRQLRAAGEEVDASTLGDSLMTPHVFEKEPAREVSRALGGKFLETLSSTEVGSWQGPIRSSFGLHLVHISSRIDGKVPALARIRSEVLREWSHDRQEDTNERFYQALLKRYQVRIMLDEQGQPPAKPGKVK